MNATTYHVCGKCGKPAQDITGWLIAQRIWKPEGYLIVRCPDHITDHARRIAGLPQEYYHKNKK